MEWMAEGEALQLDSGDIPFLDTIAAANDVTPVVLMRQPVDWATATNG